jgi:hypothetical protein
MIGLFRNSMAMVILTIVGLLAILPTSIPTQAQGTPPDYNVAPHAGLPGTEFAFYAMGFDGNERVSYWFNAPDGHIYGDKGDYITYSYNGRADWTWQSPQDAPQGYWTAVAYGISSKKQSIVPFIVGDPAAGMPAPAVPSTGDSPPASSDDSVEPEPELDIEPHHGVIPETGYQRDRFIFNATGFGSSEQVGYWFHDPTGKVYGDSGKHVVSSETGHVRWEWVSPDDARPGVWKAVAQGWITGHQVIFHFTIIDPNSPQLAPSTPPSPGADNPSQPAMLEPRPDLPPNEADVAVEPLVAIPGQQVAFRAGGYPPGETITYQVTSPDGTVYDKSKYTALTDDTGNAYWHWRVPEDAMDGIWRMQSMGDSSPLAHTIYFEVRNPDMLSQAIPGDIAIDPAAGTPGTRFFFYATGFPPGETVHYRAISPDGTEYAKSKYDTMTNEDGRADWNWRVPEDGAPGTWTMIAVGDKSLIKREITFEVY